MTHRERRQQQQDNGEDAATATPEEQCPSQQRQQQPTSAHGHESTSRQLHAERTGCRAGGLSPPPPRRAWDPGPSVTARFDSGPGPPPPLPPQPPPPLESQTYEAPLELWPLPFSLGPASRVPSLEPEPGGPEPAPEVQRGLPYGSRGPAAMRAAQAAMSCELPPAARREATNGSDETVCVAGTGDSAAGAGASARSTATVAVTAGAVFRAALRGCRCLDDLEAVLDDRVPPLPSPAEAPLALPAAESLSVPSLTAVVSALPRLPEACTAAGRRRLRRLLTSRLAPLVLLAARRGEVDAAGSAIMAAALARLGPDVVIDDSRVSRSELVDALAEVALAACRLPLTAAGGAGRWQDGHGNDDPPRRRQPQEPSMMTSRGRYGHSPRSYSTLLYALAKLGHRPDDPWLDSYLAASVLWLRRGLLPYRDLAAVAWALAALQYRPAEAWMGALLAAWSGPVGRRHSDLAGQAPAEAAEAYGLGGGGDGRGNESDEEEGGARMAAPLEEEGEVMELAAKPRRPDAHSLSLMLWALWRLGVAAAPAWLDGALARCAVPSRRPVAGAAAAAGPFAGATCQSLALVSYSLARMGHTPRAAVRHTLLAAAGPLLQRGSAQDLVLLLVGVAHWPRGAAAAEPPPRPGAPADAVVPARWLEQLCLALRPRLAGCGAQPLVLSLSALAHLRYSPGPAWLAEHEAALRPLISAGRLDGRAAARVAAAWARLRHRPGRNVVDRLLKMLVAAAAGGKMYGSGAAVAMATAPGRRWLSARLFAEGLYGIAVLVASRRSAGEHLLDHDAVRTLGLAAPPHVQGVPGAVMGPATVALTAQPPLLAAIHLRALLAASQSRLPYSYLDEVVLHLHAWRLLRVAPPHQWLANAAAVALGGKLRSAPPGVLLELLMLLAWPGWCRLLEPSRNPPQEELPPPAGNSRGGAAAAAASGGGGLPVSAALVSAVAERLIAAAEELSVRQLADLAVALVTMRVRLARSALRALTEAVAVRIEGGEGLDPKWNPKAPKPHVDLEFGGGGGGGGPVAGCTAGEHALRAAALLSAAISDPELQGQASGLLTAHFGNAAMEAPPPLPPPPPLSSSTSRVWEVKADAGSGVYGTRVYGAIERSAASEAVVEGAVWWGASREVDGLLQGEMAVVSVPSPAATGFATSGAAASYFSGPSRRDECARRASERRRRASTGIGRERPGVARATGGVGAHRLHT